MQRTFLDVNGVKTSVLTYGKGVQEVAESSDDVILVIPGNPGVTGFYKMFLHTLHESTGLPVWIVGHGGHAVSKNKGDNAQPLKGNEEIFGLKGQIEHKREFIKKYIPENSKVHVIGHSIGAYMILELLQDETINSKVIDVSFLFPTIEYMAETPNAKFLTGYIKPIVWLIVFLSWIFTLLPHVLQNILVYTYMKFTGMPKMHFRTVVDFVHPSILEKVFFLAFEEFEQVRERNNKVIKANKDKIRCLYGRTDAWTPPIYCDNLKEDIPGIRIEVTDYQHTFVLTQGRQIGKIVSEWIGLKK